MAHGLVNTVTLIGHLAGDVSIGEGCYVGMGTNIVQGRSVGPWTVIGAGAAVVHDLPANVTAVESRRV